MPKLFEADFVKTTKKVDRDRKNQYFETPVVTKMNSSQPNMKIQSHDLVQILARLNYP
jgi:hypothetical protein